MGPKVSKDVFHKLELEIELEGVEKGLRRYRESQKKFVDKGLLSITKPAQRLMIDVLEPLKKAIEAEQVICRCKTGRGRPRKYCHPLTKLSSEKLAFITVRQVINSCAKVATSKVLRAVDRLADQVKTEIDFEELIGEIELQKREAQRLNTDLPAEVKSIEKELKWIDNKRLSSAKKQLGLDDRWQPGTRRHLGAKLIRLLIDSTGAFELGITYKDWKSFGLLKMSDRMCQRLDQERLICQELARPVYAPMVSSPKPWSALNDGGYLRIKTPLIKGLKKEHTGVLRRSNMGQVYKALNLIQATRWRINRKIYHLMEKCWERDIHLVGIPQSNLPFPPKPLDYKTNHEFKRKWKKKAREIYRINNRRGSKRLHVRQVLTIANEYLDYPELFFPHNMDWRGRVYPLPQSLNPQGDDMARALIEFSEGKTVGKSGAFWLAIYLANLFGIEKGSFQKRYDWVLKHQDEIVDSAVKPIEGDMFWTKADNPWTALAACFEWNGYCENGEKWVSHIPVAMDGTCNGLQHYSAMGKDLIGAQATNLLDSPSPQDIYLNVLNIVNNLVNEDAEKGISEAKNWKGHLDRKIVKRGIMTIPYGAQLSGLREQIFDVLIEQNDTKYKVPGSKWDNAYYLARVLKKATAKMVSSAFKHMQWFRKVARLMAERNVPIVWTTPVGFVVYQGHRHTIRKEVKTALQSLIISQEIANFDTNRQIRGLPPNFIQSLDASHMMKTVVAAHEELRITSFAMVHDSYGIHACHWNEFSPLIRREFAKIYSDDVLNAFKVELESSSPNINLPAVPAKGVLDISQIIDSRYFFS